MAKRYHQDDGHDAWRDDDILEDLGLLHQEPQPLYRMVEGEWQEASTEEVDWAWQAYLADEYGARFAGLSESERASAEDEETHAIIEAWLDRDDGA